MTIKTTTLASVIATLVTLLYAAASFLPDDAEVFLFPRIIAVLVAILCGFLCVHTFTGTPADDTSAQSMFAGVLPGIGVALVYLLVMETIGFYTASFLAFVAVVTIYSDEEKFALKTILKKIAIALLFMSVLYVLFWEGLHVRTPQGILF